MYCNIQKLRVLPKIVFSASRIVLRKISLNLCKSCSPVRFPNGHGFCSVKELNLCAA